MLAVEKATIAEHAEIINDGWRYDHQNYGPSWADYEEAQIRHEFAKLGLPTIAASKNLKVGIATVQRMLRGDGTIPQLFIFRNCENTIAQMRQYRWNPHPKDKPMRGADHCCDCVRYICHSDQESFAPVKPLNLPSRFNKQYISTLLDQSAKST
jgi:hypothetical protein